MKDEIIEFFKEYSKNYPQNFVLWKDKTGLFYIEYKKEEALRHVWYDGHAVQLENPNIIYMQRRWKILFNREE